jgi:hypothetical protein
MDLPTVIILGSVCGLAGAFAMNIFMHIISSAYGKRVDMLVALGSYFTGKTNNAASLGSLLHSLAGVIFGALYFILLNKMGALIFPYAVFLGMGFGFFHGLIMSYCLMFIASERHPIEIYRKATLEEGLLHLLGHIIFGGVTGLIGGLVVLGL